MDKKFIESFLSCVVQIATLISTVYGVFSFARQKKYEKSEIALTEFYIPLLQLIEKHLYTPDYNSESFLSAKTSIHKLFKDKYIHVPFELQRRFDVFEKSKNEKDYKKFCDCFLDYYCYISKKCGIKILTIPQRTAKKWYSSGWKKSRCTINLICDFISYIVIVLCIWGVSMLVLFKVLEVITA